MSVGKAVTILSVSETCEMLKCSDPATVAMIVTGDYGDDDIGAYCEEHADQLESRDSHTTIGDVKQ